MFSPIQQRPTRATVQSGGVVNARQVQSADQVTMKTLCRTIEFKGADRRESSIVSW